MSRRARWSLVIVIAGLFIGGCAWLVWTNAPIYQVLVRLYVDKIYLKRMLREWGVLAPVIFIALQALQILTGQSIENSLSDHLQLERHGIADSMGTEDLRSGVQAFFAGEKPEFEGR